MKIMRHSIGIILYFLFMAMPTQADSIKIGWIGPLTGNSAVLGIDSLQAAMLAIDEANSNPESEHRFELIAEDDQYDAAKTVDAYSKLSAQKVAAIISSTYGGVFAIANRAERDGIVVINPLDCNEDIAKLPSTTLCIATQSESVGRVIAENISSQNLIPTTVIFDEKNPFMTLVANTVRSILGDDVIQLSGLDQTTADFKSELLKAKPKKVQSIVLLGHDPMGIAMKQARGIGIESQFYTVGTITSPGYQKLAGQNADGTLVAYWEAPESTELTDFLGKFKLKVGREPILQLASIPTYDVANILMSALKNGSGATKDRILNHFLGLKNYSGLSGNITVDPDGATRSISESLYKFNKGKLERVSKVDS